MSILTCIRPCTRDCAGLFYIYDSHRSAGHRREGTFCKLELTKKSKSNRSRLPISFVTKPNIDSQSPLIHYKVATGCLRVFCRIVVREFDEADAFVVVVFPHTNLNSRLESYLNKQTYSAFSIF